MEEDDPAPLPGCFGCLGDVSMLGVIALLITGAVAVLHRADKPQMLPLIHAAAPIRQGDDATVPPLQFCAPVAPKEQGPSVRPGDDEQEIT